MMSVRRRLDVTIERWPLKKPFAITGHTWTHCEFILVQITQDGYVGRGEAAGVYYHQENVERLREQVETARDAIENGIDRLSLANVLGAGGARNAVDAALWDLEAKLTGRPVVALAGMSGTRPLLTTFTVGIDTPEEMGQAARDYGPLKAIKVKLDGDRADADRLRAVRAAQPNAWLGLDANQGWTLFHLERLLPLLQELDVKLVEQPLRLGRDAELDGLNYPIALAADESFQTETDLDTVTGRYQVVNIKLDKCGGLTAGLALAAAARRRGLSVMVGNMLGTSLAMAPHWVLGQLCDVVDLDGPVVLARDRDRTVLYRDSMIDLPAGVWGDAG